MGAVRAQHPVGRAQELPGGPGQQPGGDPVAGGEQDYAPGGVGGGFGTGGVHPTNVTPQAPARLTSFSQGAVVSTRLLFCTSQLP